MLLLSPIFHPAQSHAALPLSFAMYRPRQSFHSVTVSQHMRFIIGEQRYMKVEIFSRLFWRDTQHAPEEAGEILRFIIIYASRCNTITRASLDSAPAWGCRAYAMAYLSTAMLKENINELCVIERDFRRPQEGTPCLLCIVYVRSFKFERYYTRGNRTENDFSTCIAAAKKYTDHHASFIWSVARFLSWY